MNITIISIPSKTSKIIGRELGVPVYYKRHAVPELENVIRWGSTRPLTVSGIEINTAEAITKASNKAGCRKLLLENGIPVPKPTETEFPLIGRTAKHSQGRGFFYIKNEADLFYAKLNGASYFSEYYPKQNEYRVHVAGGKCILMSVKEGNKSALVWNKRKSGFTFRHLRRSVWLENELLRDVVRASKRAVVLLGLDFGAVDVMSGAQGHPQPFLISEVNTSPALSPLATSKYIKFFKERMFLPNEDTY